MGGASGPHPTARRLRRLFHAYPISDAPVTGLSQEIYSWRASVLARGPPHRPAAQQVQMQVINALASMRPFVEHQSVTFAVNLPLLGNSVGDFNHSGKHGRVGSSDVVHGWDVLLGNYEHMGRCYRSDVLEGDDLFVTEDFLRRNLTLEDLAEQTVFRHSTRLGA
jgi:hypothetical protein